MRQFIYGFDVMVSFCQDGVIKPDDKTAKRCSPERALEGASDRFDSRARATGWAHIDTLWLVANCRVYFLGGRVRIDSPDARMK